MALNITAVGTIVTKTPVKLTAAGVQLQDGVTVSNYQWSTDLGQIHLIEAEDPLNKSVEIYSPTTGTANIKVIATLSDNSTQEITQAFTITDAPTDSIDSEGTRYIHELSSRNSAFLWVGYWVIYQIQQANQNEIDWESDPENEKLLYNSDLKTIAYMLQQYDNIEIQESKNGRILSREDLKSTSIY